MSPHHLRILLEHSFEKILQTDASQRKDGPFICERKINSSPGCRDQKTIHRPQSRCCPCSPILASVNKRKQRRPAAAKPRLPRSRPRLAAASLRPVALQTRPCGAGAVLWSFGAMPGPLARQTTTPSLPEGEENNAGRGPRHRPQNRCCSCSPMLALILRNSAADT